jgi:hypothetical protein
MPNPTTGDVHVNRPLTNISIAYMQDPAGFVADQVFPNIPVQKRSDRYWAYDRGDFNRNQMRKRAPGTESAGSGWKIDSTPTYYCHTWALHKDIDDETRANADEPLDLDRDATEFLSQQALLNREINFQTNFFTTGVWTTDITGVAASPTAGESEQWDVASSTPIQDVKAQNDVIHGLTGYRANRLVMGRQVWTKLSDHADFVDRIKYGSSNNQPAILARAAAAAIFEIDGVLVMDGIQNTAEEKPGFESNMSHAFIGGKNALLVYAAPRPSLLMPSGGYTFSWSAFAGAGPQGQRISRFRIDAIKSDRVESEMAYDQKVIGADLGVFFSGIVS